MPDVTKFSAESFNSVKLAGDLEAGHVHVEVTFADSAGNQLVLSMPISLTWNLSDGLSPTPDRQSLTQLSPNKPDE
jgi:hypothetical protein